MWESIRFVLFSSIESLAAFVLMTKLFRLRPMEYIWPALAVFLLMGLQSYFLRTELELSYIVPAASLLSFVLILTFVARVPIIWSAIIGAMGMFAYVAIQGIVILGGFGEYDSSMQYSRTGELIQLISSGLTFLIAYVLHQFKLGFIADFDSLRFRFEHIIVVVLVVSALIASAVVMYNNQLTHIIVFMAAASAILFYYALRKERASR